MQTTAQPRFDVILDKAVPVPMRDGTKLAADIYRPRSDERFPAVVERTPYNREESVILRTQTPQYLAQRGIAFVVQDVRGRFGSEGVWYPFVDDGWGVHRDGYDTIEWTARQPWCNGKVATAGGSYAGQTQMLLAPTRPPALACCFVREAASTLTRQWVYRGGAFEWAFNLDWCSRHGAIALRRQLGFLEKELLEPARFDGLPLASGPRFADTFRWLRDLLAHPDAGRFWQPFDFEDHYDEVDVPMVHLAGWFDIFLEGALRNFNGIRAQGRSKKTRNSQKLLIGPWTHGPLLHDPTFARHVGDMDFGPDAVLDFNGVMHRWYEHWLNDVDTGIAEEPPVRYFVMAANEWRSADSWPPPGTRPQRWYLHGGKSDSARSLNDGTLSPEKPGSREKPDRYSYDPADPVPTVGGNTLYSGLVKTGEENPDFSVTAGPRDQRSVEPRCLTYTSEPLSADLDVIGPVSVALFASSDCVDTDFVAKLCDVQPDGRSILVCDGIVRGRYRKSRTRPKLLKPKKVYRFAIDLWPTAWRFAVGHRLRVAITSSNFPRFDRNLNTGAAPLAGHEMKVATNTVFHDKDYPSHLLVEVMA